MGRQNFWSGDYVWGVVRRAIPHKMDRRSGPDDDVDVDGRHSAMRYLLR